MPQPSRVSLRNCLVVRGSMPQAALRGMRASAQLCDLLRGSSLDGPVEGLCGLSVLIATRDQLTAALALIELDGTAHRLVLCPSDVNPKHLPFIIEAAQVTAVVYDGSIEIPDHPALRHRVLASPKIVENIQNPEAGYRTEWVLLTSGTTGLPKLVVHTLDSLAGAIGPGNVSGDATIWSTFYDIRRYGGLQIFLRAVLTDASLVLSDERESTTEFLGRAATHRVTHISGTPSHWRRALMCPTASTLNPDYARLSGEIADQGILDHLHSFYPQARVAHAFASTEAGVAFDVNDGRAGFPTSLLGLGSDVELKVEDGSLRIRSSRIASHYLGPNVKALVGADGFVDTGDIVDLQGDRYHFAGRRDGVINVGGLKVHPEEVEAVINHHPGVRMSLVHARKNPLTGALVVADVVLKGTADPIDGKVAELKADLMLRCRQALAAHKVPAVINFVPALGIAETGKLMRSHA